jgi:predicted NAD/FAD-binding protein
MKFSVNWLREFVELPPSIEALAELLTMSGVEIEAIEKRGADFDHVVIARIDDSKPHPNADRLSVCIVDDGSGTKRQIVCGAKNYKVGDKVPLALPGCLPRRQAVRLPCKRRASPFQQCANVHFIPRAELRTSRSGQVRIGCARKSKASAFVPSITSSMSRIS